MLKDYKKYIKYLVKISSLTLSYGKFELLCVKKKNIIYYTGNTDSIDDFVKYFSFYKLKSDFVKYFFSSDYKLLKSISFIVVLKTLYLLILLNKKKAYFFFISLNSILKVLIINFLFVKKIQNSFNVKNINLFSGIKWKIIYEFLRSYVLSYCGDSSRKLDSTLNFFTNQNSISVKNANDENLHIEAFYNACEQKYRLAENYYFFLYNKVVKNYFIIQKKIVILNSVNKYKFYKYIRVKIINIFNKKISKTQYKLLKDFLDRVEMSIVYNFYRNKLKTLMSEIYKSINVIEILLLVIKKAIKNIFRYSKIVYTNSKYRLCKYHFLNIMIGVIKHKALLYSNYKKNLIYTEYKNISSLFDVKVMLLIIRKNTCLNWI